MIGSVCRVCWGRLKCVFWSNFLLFPAEWHSVGGAAVLGDLGVPALCLRGRFCKRFCSQK